MSKKSTTPFNPPEDVAKALRQLVSTLAGVGISHDKIAKRIQNPATGAPISRNTLRKYFKTELETGAAELECNLSATLVGLALSSTTPAQTRLNACLTVLERRFGNTWQQQPQRHEHEVEANVHVEDARAKLGAALDRALAVTATGARPGFSGKPH